MTAVVAAPLRVSRRGPHPAIVLPAQWVATGGDESLIGRPPQREPGGPGGEPSTGKDGSCAPNQVRDAQPRAGGGPHDAVNGARGWDGVPPGVEGLIKISDLSIDGHGPLIDATQALELIAALQQTAGAQSARGAGTLEQVKAGPGVQAGPQSAGVAGRVAVALYARVIAHLQARAALAQGEVLATLTKERQTDRGPGAHGGRQEARARRDGAAELALDTHTTTAEVYASDRVATCMGQVPALAAAMLQGQVDRDRAAVFTEAWARVPGQRRTSAVAGMMLQVVLDCAAKQAARELRVITAQLAEHTSPAEFEGQVARLAGVSVTDLGGGIAQLVVVDRAENIQVIKTVADVAALSARRSGAPGTLGQLRAEAVASWARHGLRVGAIPSPYGAPFPLQSDHGRPVRLVLKQRKVRTLIPSAHGITRIMWVLQDAGPLTQVQVDVLRGDPVWAGLVDTMVLIDPGSKEYRAALAKSTTAHRAMAEQKDWVHRRDQGNCRAALSPPTDFHHTTRFAESGVTEVGGLIEVHSWCHDILHRGWTTTLDPDGTAHFTDPHGNTYTTYPHGVDPTPTAGTADTGEVEPPA